MKDGDYDPCDASTFNGDVMETALEKWLENANLTSTTAENRTTGGVPWIAYYENSAMHEACGTSPLHWFYSYYMVESAQRLGASAILIDGHCPEVIFQLLPTFTPTRPPFDHCNPLQQLHTSKQHMYNTETVQIPCPARTLNLFYVNI